MNKIEILVEVDKDGKASAALKGLNRDADAVGQGLTNANAGLAKVQPSAQGILSTLGGIGAGGGAAAAGIGLVVAAYTAAVAKAYEFGEVSVQAFREAQPAALALENASRAFNGGLIQTTNNAEKLREALGSTRAEAQQVQALALQFSNLAGKSKEVERFTSAVSDLAAARGRSTSELTTIIQAALVGEDQALNRIGLPNPGQIYEEYARAIGRTSQALTQAEQSQALWNAIVKEGENNVGAQARRLDDAAYKLDIASNRWQDFKVEVGRAVAENEVFNGVLQTTIDLLKQIAPPKLTIEGDPEATARDRADSTIGRIRAAATGSITGPIEAIQGLYGGGPGFAAVFAKELEDARSLLDEARKLDAEAKELSQKQAAEKAERDALSASLKVQQTTFRDTLEVVLSEDNVKTRLQQLQHLRAEVVKLKDVFGPDAAQAIAKQLDGAIAQTTKALLLPIKELRAETDKLFADISARAGKDNPFVTLFDQADRAANNFLNTAASLRENYGSLADEVIGKLEGITKAQRDAIAGDALSQKFQDGLTALGMRREAKSLRETEDNSLSDFLKRQQGATPDPKLEGALRATNTPINADTLAAQERLQAALRGIDSGRLSINPATLAAELFGTRQAADDPAAQSARDALALVEKIRADAVASGLDERTAQKLADRFALESTAGLGRDAFGSNTDLRDARANALDRSADRVEAKEAEARRLQDEERKARAELKRSLDNLTEAINNNAERLDRVEIEVFDSSNQAKVSVLGEGYK